MENSWHATHDIVGTSSYMPTSGEDMHNFPERKLRCHSTSLLIRFLILQLIRSVVAFREGSCAGVQLAGRVPSEKSFPCRRASM
jgi:hypothetical protein